MRLVAASAVIALPGILPSPAMAAPDPALSVRGADISFTLQEEAAGNVFSDLHGNVRPVEKILAANGATYVRLRVWTNPPPGYSDLESALRLALRAKHAGLKILLDLHYSDFWADPGKQPIPVAWQGQDLPTLAATIHDYTRDAVARFAAQQTPVDMIQVGNEVTRGMLYPIGELYPAGAPAQWGPFKTLLKAGIAGAHEGAKASKDPRIMIHIDRGGDNGGSRWFFDNILAWGVSFDVIGESYYPMWHGSLADLGGNLNDIATRYGKDVVVVETQYPWTTANGDSLDNFVWAGTVLPDGDRFPPTPQGQAGYFEALRQVLLAVPGGHGLGFFAWEPEWIPGVGWEPGAGTPNDNLTMFDFTGHALPSVRAFRPPGVPAGQ